MKRISSLIILLIACKASFAQIDSAAPYYKTKILPVLNLVNIDSVAFSLESIVKGKPTIIMLFDPNCDHCQKEMELLLSMPELPQKIKLVLISIETLANIRKFYNTNHLENCPWIFLGKDFKYAVGSFYRPGTVPILVFYNEKGQFIDIKHGNADKKTILGVLNR